MAIVSSLPVLLLLGLVLNVQGRAPGLYYPTPGQDLTPAKISRSHLEETSLSPLTESELETLLYLLDKVQRPPVPHHHVGSYGGEGRMTKRTGAHHLTNLPPPPKRAPRPAEWSDYFGIDKREVKVLSPIDLTLLQPDITNTPADHKKETPGQKSRTEKEREDILREFYKNMAMSANVRRKREIRRDSGGAAGKEMGKLGDNLIWDALKLTGAHRDEKMSQMELDHLKKQLIQRIGAAYDLEKLRQVLDGGERDPTTNAIGQ